MKNRNKIEKHMSDLARKDSQTPPSFVWAEIEQHLDDKDSRKIAWWWILLPMLLLVFPAYLMLFTEADTGTNDSSFVETPNTEIPQTIVENPTPSKSNNTDTNESIKILDADQEQIIASNNINDQSQETNTSTSSSTLSGKKTVKKDNLVKLTTSTSVSNSISQRISANITENQNNNNLQSSNVLLLNDKPSTDTKTTEVKTQEETFIAVNNIAEADNAKAVSSQDFININRLPFYKSELKIAQNIPLLELNPLDMMLDREIDHNDNSPWFVSLAGYLGVQNVNFESIEGDVFSSREEAESQWYSWGTDFQLGYELSDRFYITGGISYRELKSKFDYELRSISETYVDTFSSFESISISDTLFFSRGETKQRFIDLPILVGYQHKINKFSFGLEVGAAINLFSSESGKIHLGSGQISRLEDLNYNKSTVGVSLHVNAVLGYELSDQFTVLLKPNARYYLSDTYNSTSPYSKNISLVGTSIGMRYRF